MALSAGVASAEIALSGSAVMGVGDNGTDIVSKMETYLTFTGSVDTESGLSFGMSTTIATYDTNGGLNDDGTSVYMSGSFGKLSMGSVAEADEVATLSDIGGIGGLGVDNVAEAFSGDSIGKIVEGVADAYGLGDDDTKALTAALGNSHNVNYTVTVGSLTASASGRIGNDNDSYAVGAKYAFGDAYVGLGYNTTKSAAFDIVDVTKLEMDTTSVYAGGTMGAVSVAAMYSDLSATATVDGDAEKVGGKAYGLTAAYSMDALTMSVAYSNAELDGEDTDAYGLGVSYDLGAGAAVTGGVASVSDETVWEAGVSFSF